MEENYSRKAECTFSKWIVVANRFDKSGQTGIRLWHSAAAAAALARVHITRDKTVAIFISMYAIIAKLAGDVIRAR